MENIDLINEVKRLKDEILKYEMALETCKMYAENIELRGCGESMDAHYIGREANKALSE